jgi:hypothetical protein
VKKSTKRPVSPFAGYVCTTPEPIEADKPLLSCRVALKIDNVNDDKSVPAPAHTTYLAAVSRNRKDMKAKK